MIMIEWITIYINIYYINRVLFFEQFWDFDDVRNRLQRKMAAMSRGIEGLKLWEKSGKSELYVFSAIAECVQIFYFWKYMVTFYFVRQIISSLACICNSFILHCDCKHVTTLHKMRKKWLIDPIKILFPCNMKSTDLKGIRVLHQPYSDLCSSWREVLNLTSFENGSGPVKEFFGVFFYFGQFVHG